MWIRDSFGRLRNPKRDMLWVAAAGPAVNLAMALAWAVLLKLAIVMPHTMYTRSLAMMSDTGININIVLMVLNLLPLPPLDGGRIAVSLLPYRLAAVSYTHLDVYKRQCPQFDWQKTSRCSRGNKRRIALGGML